MEYLNWNNAIGAKFFNRDRDGTRVFLYVNRDIINEIGAPYQSDNEDFLKAIKTGPPWITRHQQSICQHALQASEKWRGKSLTYPPYLAYLALFVLADTIEMPDFARQAYYPGLRKLIGEEPKIGMYPSFNRMHLIWDDLAVWSNQDKGGEWGIFDADIVGEWMHVGIPRAQTILTEKERQDLPLLFGENGFDPLSPPSDVELAYLLSHDTKRCLRPHTKDLLRSKEEHDKPIRDVLIEAFLEELQNWDGSIPPQDEQGQTARSSLGNLRLAMILDKTSRTAKFYLRCRSNREYPEEGLKLTTGELPEALFCFGDWQGWSTPLYVDEARKEIFDASQLDWQGSAAFTDAEHSWRANLTKRKIRILVSGNLYGFSGFVEESQMPCGKSFYLLVHESCSSQVEDWGRTSCINFESLDIQSGMAATWRLYSIDRVISDESISKTFPFLAFSKTLLIQPIGGLKVRGNQYFSFALPKLRLTGKVDDIQLYCNDLPIPYDQNTNLYSLPRIMRTNRLVIEARQDKNCIRKRSIYISDTIDWQLEQPASRFDRLGCRLLDEVPESCFGPIVEGFSVQDLNFDIFLPPTAENRVFFVGRNPGEIVVCPKEPLPSDWIPVWAIPMRRKGYAIFCTSNPDNAAPTKLIKGSKKHLKLWKDVLWNRRKRIASPKHPLLSKLWNEYREVAHSVC